MTVSYGDSAGPVASAEPNGPAGQQPTLMTKRTLVTLSHAIEQAALRSADDGPLVIVSLFQRLPYFDREREVYRTLAARADVLVVGFVDDFRPDLAGLAHPVLLDLAEPLAREWSVVMVTPRSGAFLVAHDNESVSPGELTLEAGRLFSTRWGFHRDAAREELRRLRQQLTTRLPPGALTVMDRVVESAGGPEVEPDAAGQRLEASARMLVEQLESARRYSASLKDRLDSLTVTADRDPVSGLHTPSFLRRWVGSTRTTTSGPLPLALTLVSVDGLGHIQHRGARGAMEGVSAVAGALTRWLGPADRAIRLDEEDFLIVAPGADLDRACVVAQQLSADLDGFRLYYPFLPVAPVLATMVTRERPLPLERLRDGVQWARERQFPVVALP